MTSPHRTFTLRAWDYISLTHKSEGMLVYYCTSVSTMTELWLTTVESGCYSRQRQILLFLTRIPHWRWSLTCLLQHQCGLVAPVVKWPWCETVISWHCVATIGLLNSELESMWKELALAYLMHHGGVGLKKDLGQSKQFHLEVWICNLLNMVKECCPIRRDDGCLKWSRN